MLTHLGYLSWPPVFAERWKVIDPFSKGKTVSSSLTTQCELKSQIKFLINLLTNTSIKSLLPGGAATNIA